MYNCIHTLIILILQRSLFSILCNTLIHTNLSWLPTLSSGLILVSQSCCLFVRNQCCYPVRLSPLLVALLYTESKPEREGNKLAVSIKLTSEISRLSHDCHMIINMASGISRHLIIKMTSGTSHDSYMMIKMVSKTSHDCYMMIKIASGVTWKSYDDQNGLRDVTWSLFALAGV